MEQRKKKVQHEMQGVSVDETMELNLDVRYQISNTRNNPVNIYAYVRENRDDPAFSVCFSF